MALPHIILIISDEHRGQAMSLAGDINVRTPELDRMAHDGTSFARAYANCPICTPSRGTLFSGRHAHCGPVSGFFDHYKASFPSLATELASRGYQTAYFGKWHCGVVHDQLPPSVRENPERFPGGVRTRTPEHFRAGFNDWLGFENLNQHFSVSAYRNLNTEPERFEGYETDVLTDEAIRYIQNYRGERPLFLVLSVTPPHFPMLVPIEWQRHEPSKLEVSQNFMTWKGVPTACCQDGGGTLINEEEARKNLALYYDMIENLDFNVGRVRQALDTSLEFQREKTLSIYLSDHGDFMGSHGYYCQKSHPHEESVRIPAMFTWPGQISARGPVSGLFGLVDVLATILGLTGLPIPSWNQGADWSSVLRGDSFEPPVCCQLLEIIGNPRWTLDHLDWRGLVTERWKYAFYETGMEILFDLQNDPWELSNQAAQNPEATARLRKWLLEELLRTREPSFDVMITHGVKNRIPVTNVASVDYPVFAIEDTLQRHISCSLS